MRVLTVLVLLAAAGCNSYKIMQTSHFASDDGAIVRVDYGRAKKNHVNTFVSPANGREMEFKTKLVVEVQMPERPSGMTEFPFDGESFTAWQCMNFNGNGTKYKTDNDEWFFLANGFTCKIARRDERFASGYREVFSGVLCNTPVNAAGKDSRWHKVRPNQGTTKGR